MRGAPLFGRLICGPRICMRWHTSVGKHAPAFSGRPSRPAPPGFINARPACRPDCGARSLLVRCARIPLPPPCARLRDAWSGPHGTLLPWLHFLVPLRGSLPGDS